MTTPEGTAGHRAAAKSLSARCAVVIVSDSRTAETDESGPLARTLLEDAGHTVSHFALIPNGVARVRAEVEPLLARNDLDVVLLSGGTGLGSRDQTVEAVHGLLDRELPGFGELFRWESYTKQIGTAAMLSRALAGSANGKLVVVLPGAKAAVDLALRTLLLPELRHLLHELRR